MKPFANCGADGEARPTCEDPWCYHDCSEDATCHEQEDVVTFDPMYFHPPDNNQATGFRCHCPEGQFG